MCGVHREGKVIYAGQNRLARLIKKDITQCAFYPKKIFILTAYKHFCYWINTPDARLHQDFRAHRVGFSRTYKLIQAPINFISCNIFATFAGMHLFKPVYQIIDFL